MFLWLIRIAMAIGAISCMLDVALPTVTQSSQIVGHSRTITTTVNGGIPTHNTSYELGLATGRTHTCSVDATAYDLLHDDDTVMVTTSRFFKSCVTVIHDDEKVYAQKYWRYIRALIAAVLFVIIIGTFFGNNSNQSGYNNNDTYSYSYTIVDSHSSGDGGNTNS